jgi:hypothetical protein
VLLEHMLPLGRQHVRPVLLEPIHLLVQGVVHSVLLERTSQQVGLRRVQVVQREQLPVLLVQLLPQHVLLVLQASILLLQELPVASNALQGHTQIYQGHYHVTIALLEHTHQPGRQAVQLVHWEHFHLEPALGLVHHAQQVNILMSRAQLSVLTVPL